MKKFILLLTITLLFSCSTDNNEARNQSDEIQLLKRIYVTTDFLDNELIWEYEYNEDNNLSKIKGISHGIVNHVKAFEYLNDTIYSEFRWLPLTSETNDTYAYNGKLYIIDSQTTQYEQRRPSDNSLTRKQRQHYESCGITTTEVYNVLTNEVLYQSENEYTDSNCSYQRTYDSGQISFYRKHDDKNNFRKSLNALPIQYRTKHNIIERRTYHENGDLDIGGDNLNYNSTFIYDENDYPIQQTLVTLNGNVTTVFNYEYYD